MVQVVPTAEAIEAMITCEIKMKTIWKLVITMRRDILNEVFALFICTLVSRPV